MSSVFGWDLPPGCTTADIDRAVGEDEEDREDRMYDMLLRLYDALDSIDLPREMDPLFFELRDLLDDLNDEGETEPARGAGDD